MQLPLQVDRTRWLQGVFMGGDQGAMGACMDRMHRWQDGEVLHGGLLVIGCCVWPCTKKAVLRDLRACCLAILGIVGRQVGASKSTPADDLCVHVRGVALFIYIPGLCLLHRALYAFVPAQWV
jgi:hypothetical protein